jgi:uncharacterized membrane protein
VLDAWRGLAMVWMALFHFAFDLNHFGLLAPRQNFYVDSLWTLQRTVIVSLFLFCAGIAQSLAPALPLAGAGAWRFWRRWLQIAGCALLVSIGSAWMFPRSWIFFGVLHGIAAMLILLRLAAPLGAWLWPLALACLLLPLAAQPWFDQPLLAWLGLRTHKPITEDYVPLLPWLGVMLAGLACGRWLQRRPRRAALPRALAPLAPLAALGRWPLTFYMLHQPVLIGLLLLALKLR